MKINKAGKSKSASLPAPDIKEMVESVVGSKWTIHVLSQIRKGVNRPGALVRSGDGLTYGVLNHRLAKLVGFGILKKINYPKLPQAEYRLTRLGQRFVQILDEIETLRRDLAAGKLA